MPTRIINLTLPVVNEKLEEVLETYPNTPYQQVFSIPKLHQELLVYILNRIQTTYAVIDDAESETGRLKASHSCLSEQLQIEPIVHAGIQQILQHSNELISHQIPACDEPFGAMSHWFG